MSQAEPNLDAPGAGIPTMERLLLKHIALPLLSRKLSREDAIELFEKEGRDALSIAKGLSEAELKQTVLIDRIRAIEDSSRNWSVAMTLHHLLIVGPTIKQGIQLLNSGKVPPKEARIEDVKPDPGTGPEIIEKFEAFLDSYPEGLSGLPWPKDVRYAHPWFGPMNADRWLRLNAVHNGVHRKQIEKIVKGLNRV